MPYSVKKCTACGCGTWKVYNTQTGHEYAKHTTKQKAMAQLRLLNAVEHGWKPTGKKPVKLKITK